MMPPLLPDDHEMLARVMPAFDFASEDAMIIGKTLTEAMLRYGGVGLAANQVGIETRAFAIIIDDEPQAWINPRILWSSDENVLLNEGCLTFDGLDLRIKRPKDCQVEYYDVFGKQQIAQLTGWNSRVAQHEQDHLNGIVFTSRVSKLKLSMAIKRRTKMK